MRRSLFVVIAVALLGFTASASAAPSWLAPSELAAGGPIEQPGNALLEWPPSIAVDGEGNATVVTSRDPASGFVTLGISRPAGGPWEPPAELSRTGENSVAPQVAFDAAGDETAIWSNFESSKGSIMSATRRADGAWGEPVAISAPGAQFNLNSLAVAPGGEATAVWVAQVGPEEDVVEASSRPAGGAWEEPVELSAVATGPIPLPAADDARVATDAAGDLTAVWAFGPTPESTIQVARRPAGGTWGKPTTVSATDAFAGSPVLAVNAGGDADLAWTSQSDDFSEFSIQSATSVAGGPWEPHAVVAHLSTDVGVGGLAMDPAGEATVIWLQVGSPGATVETASRAAGGDWGPAVRLGGGKSAEEPDVAYRGDEPVAIWHQWEEGGANVIDTAGRSDDGTWGAPTDISSGDARFVEAPELAFDAEGEGIAAWYSSEGEGNDPEYEVEAAGYDAAGPRLGSASIPTTGTAGTPVDFSASPLDVWSGVGATEWTFGDGGSAGGPSASHTYASPGTYAVTLRSTDLVGNASTVTGTITIGPAPPTAAESPPPIPTVSTSTSAPPKEGRPRVDLRYTPNRPHHPNPSGGPRYTFHFSDPTGRATFWCRLDRAPFRRCDSPKVYRGLRRGPHVFRVKALSPTSGSSPIRTVHFAAGRHG
ncbi:MAG TPA: PKD domain-containing protein [Solirubrobacterales bacterium]|nr:PKD domain-containing protein [Solirubrobacterales bacterium]